MHIQLWSLLCVCVRVCKRSDHERGSASQRQVLILLASPQQMLTLIDGATRNCATLSVWKQL